MSNRRMLYSYSDFKTKIILNNICFKETLDTINSDKYYYIYAFDGADLLECFINTVNHSSDVTDYETNYSSMANQSNGISNVNIHPRTNIIQKFYYDYNQQDIVCGDSWVEFYDYSFNSQKRILEIMVAAENNHLLKIDVDQNTVLEIDIRDVQGLLDHLPEALVNVVLANDGGTRRIGLRFNDFYGTQIEIYQKKRGSGTTTLTLHGYAVTYEEEK